VVGRLNLAERDGEITRPLPPITKKETVTLSDDSISVLGLGGLLTHLGKCCKPAPGDEIIGYITRGRGATIHRTDCPNVLRVKDKERLIQASWGAPKDTYPVSVRIMAYDRGGLMRDVSNVVTEEGISMSQVKVDVDQHNEAVFDLTLNVGDVEQLSRVLTRMESLPNVVEARRVRPG
jgi:guanosine-3',5'-bis(diphosphate) 3'-pyrophosphohydrolase